MPTGFKMVPTGACPLLALCRRDFCGGLRGAPLLSDFSFFVFGREMFVSIPNFESLEDFSLRLDFDYRKSGFRYAHDRKAMRSLISMQAFIVVRRLYAHSANFRAPCAAFHPLLRIQNVSKK